VRALPRLLGALALGTACETSATGDATGTDWGDGGYFPGAGHADAGAFDQLGVCGQRAEAFVSPDDYHGFEDLFLLADEGFGDEINVSGRTSWSTRTRAC
jgi:hypothetical protein